MKINSRFFTTENTEDIEERLKKTPCSAPNVPFGDVTSVVDFHGD